MEQHQQILKKFQRILSLTDKQIILNYIPQQILNNKQSTSIEWNEKEKSWYLTYINQGYRFLLIHELGHLFLSKKTGCPYFAKPASQSVDKDVFNYNNSIVDSFVNFRISRYNEIYLQFIDYIDGTFITCKNGIKSNTPNLLSYYINFYCDLNFSIRLMDKKKQHIKIQNFLTDIKSLILTKKEYNFSNKQFELIDNKLNEFNDIKYTDDKKVIIQFIAQLLKIIPFKNDIKQDEQLNKLYLFKVPS